MTPCFVSDMCQHQQKRIRDEHKLQERDNNHVPRTLGAAMSYTSNRRHDHQDETLRQVTVA